MCGIFCFISSPVLWSPPLGRIHCYPTSLSTFSVFLLYHLAHCDYNLLHVRPPHQTVASQGQEVSLIHLFVFPKAATGPDSGQVFRERACPAPEPTARSRSCSLSEWEVGLGRKVGIGLWHILVWALRPPTGNNFTSENKCF